MARPRKKRLPQGIYERRYASGRTAYWIDFTDRNGRRIQEVGGTTIEDAERLLAQRRRAVADGSYGSDVGTGEQTVATYADRWVEVRKREGIVTHVREAAILRLHVKPVLGALRMRDVRPRDIAGFVRGLTGKLGPKTIHNVHGIVSSMFTRARFDDLIGDNPAKGLPRGVLPKKTRTRVRAAWTRDEIVKWISKSPRVPEDRTVAYAIAAFTGARVGEVAGMRWRDLDASAKPLTRWVLRTQYDGQPLKTEKPRDVPIHAELQKILDEWKREGWPKLMKRHPTKDDFVIARDPDRRWKRPLHGDKPHHSAQSLGAKGMKPHAKWLGIDSSDRDFHSFRRSMITLARTDGARAEIIERITHNAAGAMIDGYTYFGWEILCEEISKLRVASKKSVVRPLKKAPQRDASRDVTGSGIAKASVINELEAEEKGFEPLVEFPPRRFSKPLP